MIPVSPLPPRLKDDYDACLDDAHQSVLGLFDINAKDDYNKRLRQILADFLDDGLLIGIRSKLPADQAEFLREINEIATNLTPNRFNPEAIQSLAARLRAAHQRNATVTQSDKDREKIKQSQNEAQYNFDRYRQAANSLSDAQKRNDKLSETIRSIRSMSETLDLPPHVKSRLRKLLDPTDH